MLGCVIMASGHSSRFGEDKLFLPIDGIPMAQRALDAVPDGVFECVAVVFRDDRLDSMASERGFSAIHNTDGSGDSAITIRLGLSALPDELDGCMFMVCDQPLLTSDSIGSLVEAFVASPDSIIRLSFGNKEGNPVIFPAALFNELLALPPFESGRYVISRHRSLVQCVQATDESELSDVDSPSDLPL